MFASKAVGAIIFLVIFGASSINAQYYGDLRDVHISSIPLMPGEHHPACIGNLGNLDLVVDLRGFVPMSLESKEAMGKNDTTVSSAVSRVTKDQIEAGPLPVPTDYLRWYEIPTRKALLFLYFGDLAWAHLADETAQQERTRFSGTRFLKESDAKGDPASWCTLAYQLVKNSQPIFNQVAGDGFQAAEPTTIFFNEQSAFVLMNFRYKNVLRYKGTGQLLGAFEFSRSSKQCKNFYELYSTMLVNKPTSEAFVETVPIVTKILLQVYGLH